MRTRIMMYAALLWLGIVNTAWASPGARPALERATPLTNDGLQKPVAPPVPLRGQMLYENHCLSCHESIVHIRAKQRTRSLAELHGTVVHWAGYLGLRWGRDEVEDVVNYLDSHYYKFESR